MKQWLLLSANHVNRSENRPELVGLAVVVGAGVSASTMPPKRLAGAAVVAPVVTLVVVGAGVRAFVSPPNSPAGAAVVAGTAPAASMQLGSQDQNTTTKVKQWLLSANHVNGSKQT